MTYVIRDDFPEDEDVARLMRDHNLGATTAEAAQEIIDDGLDEQEAIEIADDL